MALPTLSGVARLVDDPELSFTQSGTAVAKMRLAFNSRRRNDRGEWEDADVFWVKATVWRQLAENVAESLAKGMEVVVTGEIRTESWEDRQSGEKRQAPALLLRSIGPNLSFATASVTKAASNGPAQGRPAQQSQPHQRGRQAGAQPPADDPWATTPGATPQGGAAWANQQPADEPPF